MDKSKFVEVIRCKDCKKSMMMPDITGKEFLACVQEIKGEYRVSRWVDENGFCDWGLDNKK